MKKGKLYAALALGLAVLLGLWIMRHKAEKKVDGAIKSPVLTPSETAKVIVDPRNHTITTVTRQTGGGTKTTATYLPPTGASVSVGKGGEVLVTTRSWGTEKAPFVGIAIGSDIHGKVALGLNLFYIRRWELGGGLVGGSIHDVRLFAHVSYNPYANYFVSLGIDHKQTAMLTAGIKF